MSNSGTGDLAGEVSVSEAWEELAARPDATLIDVRTQAEWTYVGVPALDSLGKAPLLVEWQTFPAMGVDTGFVEKLAAQLEELGIGKDAPLYFICRSGARSHSAAIAMAAAGYGNCYNVREGFEGPLDPDRHRGAVNGWKAAGLPWTQS
jgi:rhodanese-related sulfurtransferase